MYGSPWDGPTPPVVHLFNLFHLGDPVSLVGLVAPLGLPAPLLRPFHPVALVGLLAPLGLAALRVRQPQ